MKQIFLPTKTPHFGLDIIRIICGGIIFSFGLEILNVEQLTGYTEWLTDVGMPFPKIMVYVGKLAELICGLFLCVGLFTRFACIPLIITMFVVSFIMLDGKIRTEPFYLLLLFACFFFIGSGKISVDYLRKRSSQHSNKKV
ncbi:MAG: DoxX family protein [Jejuia sp.]